MKEVMTEVLSQLVRKPSKATDEELVITGWRDKQSKVLEHMSQDKDLMKLLEEFRVANERLKFIRSKNDIKIYFTTQEKRGEEYQYARCMFMINGKQKEFRKYLGKVEDVKLNKLDLGELKKTFLMMLRNFLEYHK